MRAIKRTPERVILICKHGGNTVYKSRSRSRVRKTILTENLRINTSHICSILTFKHFLFMFQGAGVCSIHPVDFTILKPHWQPYKANIGQVQHTNHC